MQLCDLGIKVDDVACFVATVRYQSISRAADMLGLTQPSVTRRIQALEDVLGVTLLDRNTRPPRPTAIGLRVFEKGQEIVRDIQALKSLVDVSNDRPEGPIHLGLPRRIAELTLGSLFQTLKQHYPALSLRAQTAWSTDLLDMLQSNSLHAAIVYAASAARLSDGLVARELVPLDIRVVAPKGLFSSCSLQLADCATQPWVINPEGCVFRRQLVNALLAAGLPFELAMEGFGVELQMQLVARGLGLGLLPLPCIEGSSFRSQVDILDIGDFSINSALWLVHSSMLGNLQQAVDLCARSITDSLIMLPERG